MTRKRIPKIGDHRGVPLDDCQPEERLVDVRRDIDAVFDEADTQALLRIVDNIRWAPEARRFAAAKLEAQYQIAIDERKIRPEIDLQYVAACIAGLDDMTWRDPWFYCSLLDRRALSTLGNEPVRREKPLER